MGVKSSRMALRLLSATAAPASTTSLPNIFGSIVAARAEAKLRSKNKTHRSRDLGVGARPNVAQRISIDA